MSKPSDGLSISELPSGLARRIKRCVVTYSSSRRISARKGKIPGSKAKDNNQEKVDLDKLLRPY